MAPQKPLTASTLSSTTAPTWSMSMAMTAIIFMVLPLIPLFCPDKGVLQLTPSIFLSPFPGTMAVPYPFHAPPFYAINTLSL
jgi:hypothetical protein